MLGAKIIEKKCEKSVFIICSKARGKNNKRVIRKSVNCHTVRSENIRKTIFNSKARSKNYRKKILKYSLIFISTSRSENNTNEIQNKSVLIFINEKRGNFQI